MLNAWTTLRVVHSKYSAKPGGCRRAFYNQVQHLPSYRNSKVYVWYRVQEPTLSQRTVLVLLAAMLSRREHHIHPYVTTLIRERKNIASVLNPTPVPNTTSSDDRLLPRIRCRIRAGSESLRSQLDNPTCSTRITKKTVACAYIVYIC